MARRPLPWPFSLKRRASAKGELVCGAVAMAFGLFLTGIGVHTLWTVRSARAWPAIQGVVESSDLKQARRRKGTMQYHLNVRYRYEVAGTPYIGSKLNLSGNAAGPHAEAIDHLNKYSPGRPCLVHYDPDDPSDACLLPESRTNGWLFFGLGVPLVSGAALFASRRLSWKLRRESTRN